MSTPLLELVEQAQKTGDFSSFIEAVPYWRFMGLSARLKDGELQGVLTYSDKLIGNPALPALHGGTIGALLETTAVLELFNQAETVVIPKTIQSDRGLPALGKARRYLRNGADYQTGPSRGRRAGRSLAG